MQLRHEFVPRRSTVDQHGRRAPRLQKNRVPLAYVENLDPQPRSRREGRPVATGAIGYEDKRPDTRNHQADCDPHQPPSLARSPGTNREARRLDRRPGRLGTRS
jgi:hypothetical protein